MLHTKFQGHRSIGFREDFKAAEWSKKSTFIQLVLIWKRSNDKLGFIIPAGCGKKCFCFHNYTIVKYKVFAGNACRYGMGNTRIDVA